jgi:hypothetical protein
VEIFHGNAGAGEDSVNSASLVLALLDEAYEEKTWHGPNFTLHAAYWKYIVRRRIEGQKRGSFALKGSNFFARPEKAQLNEKAWRADKELLEREHVALVKTIGKALSNLRGKSVPKAFYGIAFHDVYHAGQIRLLRRLMERGSES